jgi:ligand-binding SRPBCC domain-containing protein
VFWTERRRVYTEILLKTRINAPVDKCFDLARSIDFHLQSARTTREQAVDGVTAGLISLGEEVEWKARHLGRWWRMRVKITEFEPPRRFQDTMIKGPFHSFSHDHAFDPCDSGTLMTDVVRFQSPVPVLGRLLDRLVVGQYLRRFLRLRNIQLKAEAEANLWHK